MSRAARALLLLALVAGCAGEAKGPVSTNRHRRLDATHSGRIYTIRSGDTVSIALRADRSAGLRWQTVRNPAPMLRQVGLPEFVPDSAPASGLSRPGTETWTFIADQPGLVTVQLEHRKMLEQFKAPVATFLVDITVK